MRVGCIGICGLSDSTGFFHIDSLLAPFSLKLLHLKLVFSLSLKIMPETFLILKRTERDMIKKIYTGLHVKQP